MVITLCFFNQLGTKSIRAEHGVIFIFSFTLTINQDSTFLRVKPVSPLIAMIVHDFKYSISIVFVCASCSHVIDISQGSNLDAVYIYSTAKSALRKVSY